MDAGTLKDQLFVIAIFPRMFMDRIPMYPGINGRSWLIEGYHYVLRFYG